MSQIKLALVIGGLFLVFMGVQEQRLASKASVEPQAISLAELQEKGVGDNANVVVSDFLMLQQNYVYVEKKGRWTEAWVPAVPLGGEYHNALLAVLDEEGRLLEGEAYPVPKDIRVIVKLPNARYGADIGVAANADTLQGMVVNEIESLGAGEKKILVESYPGVDFDTCYILEEGRKPASLAKIVGFILGGVVLSGLGVVLLLRDRAMRQGASQASPPEQEEVATA